MTTLDADRVERVILQTSGGDGEPRIRDLDLADRLGFEPPLEIRRLIQRNREDRRPRGFPEAAGPGWTIVEATRERHTLWRLPVQARLEKGRGK